MKKRIVLITDCVDVAYNELRGVILSHIENITTEFTIEIEPVVPVYSFSVTNGNFILRLMADAYPEGTIFAVILNPLQIRPARILGRTKKKNFYFIGANTGVFDWFFKEYGVEELYELNDPGFFPFGGKYVHAPAIAQIAAGKPLHTMGKPFSIQNLVSLHINNGEIIHIDSFGLMKFTGELTQLHEGDLLEISLAGQCIKAVYATRMMSCETGEWVVYPGSSFGLYELGKVRCNGAQELNAAIGDIIQVTHHI